MLARRAGLGSARPWLSQSSSRSLRHNVPHAVTKQLPIFPLGVVPFPSTAVPLVIFEARYRVLFNTLLAGNTGIEDGLVQEDSPFCGTRQFGMCYYSKDRLAGIGATLHIDEYVHMEDGRMVVTTKGTERFRIKAVIKERPVLVCEVEVLDEDDDTSEEAQALAAEVTDLFRETFKLHMKVQKLVATEELAEPEDLSIKSPKDLSYFVANTFMDNRGVQQALLEEDNTAKRLLLEKEILTKTMQFYVAASAVKQAFSADGSAVPEQADESAKSSEKEDGGRTPPSGPD